MKNWLLCVAASLLSVSMLLLSGCEAVSSANATSTAYLKVPANEYKTTIESRYNLDIIALTPSGRLENISGKTYIMLKDGKIELPVTFSDDLLAQTHPNITDPSFDPNLLTDSSLSYFSDTDVFAIAYVDNTANNNTTVRTLVSVDQGKTWNTSTIIAPTMYLSISFTSKQDGWLVQTSDPATGNTIKRIFHSTDGGASWIETQFSKIQPSETFPGAYYGLLTGSAFITSEIGFLCYRFYQDNGPEVYRTNDSGTTWNRIDFPIPPEYINDNFMPSSPVFDNANGLIGIITVDGVAKRTGVMLFKTYDYGETWSYDDFVPDER